MDISSRAINHTTKAQQRRGQKQMRANEVISSPVKIRTIRVILELFGNERKDALKCGLPRPKQASSTYTDGCGNNTTVQSHQSTKFNSSMVIMIM